MAVTGAPAVRAPLVLFAATVVTTLGAGSLLAGANPFADPTVLVEGVPFAASLLTILVAHELSHYLTSRRHGVRSTLPLFIPAPPFIGTFGAVIRIQSPIPDRRSLLEIGISGPLGGFLVALPLAVAGLSLSRVETGLLPVPGGGGGGIGLGDSLVFSLMTRIVLGPMPDDAALFLHPVAFAAWIGFFVTSINLLPVGQLDGGHILHALLGRRQETVSRAVVLLLAPLGFFWWGWFLWGGMLLLLGLRHPRVVYEDSPLDRTRMVFAGIGVLLLVLTFTPAPFQF